MASMTRLRVLSGVALLALLAGCARPGMDAPPEDLGEFHARVQYVFTENATQGPVSRDATPDEWKVALEQALADRMARYDGSREFDIGVSLEGYMLAPPGVPVLYSPKSTAVVYVHLYDVAAKEFVARKKELQVFESTTGESALVGSGNARTREEQIQGLAENVARRIELWLEEENELNGWFDPLPAAAAEPEAPTGEDPAPAPGSAAAADPAPASEPVIGEAPADG